MRTADFAIVGGGVVGLTVALEVRRRHPGARIVVLEKEARCGEHASGRNSGVLHAGFSYHTAAQSTGCFMPSAVDCADDPSAHPAASMHDDARRRLNQRRPF
jgi:glycine/D-amino acid oxidase-like deaminating enzyme